MPALQRTSDLTLLVVAGAVTLFLSATSFLLAPVDSTPPLPGSSFASHPSGSRAVYLALQAAGYRVERSYEPLSTLRRDPGSVALILAEPIAKASDQDRRAMQRLLQRGAVVLAIGRGASVMLPDLQVGSPRAEAAVSAAAAMVSPISRGVPAIHLPPGGSLADGSIYIPVYGDAERAAVVAANIGKGRAVWVAAIFPFTNEGIARAGHAELLSNVLGPPGDRTILWDEHYHGHSRSLWSYMAGTPLPFAVLQIAIVGALALVSLSRRRSPPRAVHDEVRSSPLEFIDSMGSLYERAGTATGAVATVYRRARRTLVEACGMPSSASNAQLAAALSARSGWPADRIEALLATGEKAANDPTLPSAEALSVTAGLQELARESRRDARGQRSRAANGDARESRRSESFAV
jgi:hypothetical protein